MSQAAELSQLGSLITVDVANLFVGVRVATPEHDWDVRGEIGAVTSGVNALLALRRHAGSASAPTAIAGSVNLGRVAFRGFDGTAYQNVAQILSTSDGAISSTSSPGNLRFLTTPSGSVTAVDRLTIGSDGSFQAVVPGGTTLYPTFMCRAWVSFNGTGTVVIVGSGNVTSITDNGVGDYTANFTTAMPDGNYSFAGVLNAGTLDSNASVKLKSSTNSAGQAAAPAAKTTTACQIATGNGTTVDSSSINLCFFR